MNLYKIQSMWTVMVTLQDVVTLWSLSVWHSACCWGRCRVWEADTLSCCQTHTDCELLGGGGWFSCRRGGGLWQPEICLPYEWLYSFLILCLRLIIWWREVSLFMAPLCPFSRWSALLKGLPSQMHLLSLKMKPRRYGHLISPIKIKVSLGANLCSSNMLCVTGGRFYDPQRHRWRAEPVFKDRGFQLHVRAWNIWVVVEKGL